MDNITTHNIGIIMNGVTGRMGTNQHLIRSICAIREQGGVKIGDNEVIMPDPILVGRNAAKLEKLAKQNGVERWSTNLDETLADSNNTIYFDAQLTQLRAPAVKKPSKRASTSTAKSRPAFRSKKPMNSIHWPRSAASSTAWCRTNCGCPA
jgi:hypothetical protein